jgi:predicted transcriptional regulator
MSSKTRTRKPRTTTTGSTRALRSVPEPTSEPSAATKARTETEDKLWAALHASPNSTAADLSVAATIGKSTAAKILAKWAGDGSVTRTAGIAEGGRRAADLWAITETDIAAPTAKDAEPMDAVTAPEPGDGDDASDNGGREEPARLAPGALRGLVEDYLSDHPGEEFSPSAIGKALDRSSGAVNNALEKLVLDGYAVKTKEAPKRFALAAASAPTPDATTN